MGLAFSAISQALNAILGFPTVQGPNGAYYPVARPHAFALFPFTRFLTPKFLLPVVTLSGSSGSTPDMVRAITRPNLDNKHARYEGEDHSSSCSASGRNPVFNLNGHSSPNGKFPDA